MTNHDDQGAGNSDSDSIYRAPTSDTSFAPGDDALAAFVGLKNADYYSRHFDRFENQGGSISWNWPAFFISSFWLLYRKMWLNAFLYWIVLPIILTVITGFIAASSSAQAGGMFYYGTYLVIAFILLPLFANKLYYRHAQGKVNKVASITSSPEQQRMELARIGGTSNVVLVVIPIILIAMVGILAAIAIPAYQDYTIRAQVSEGLNLSGGAKAAVAELYADTGQLAVDNKTAGLAPANRISGNYVSSVAVQGGEIIVTYGNNAHMGISGETLILTPERQSETSLAWDCSSPSIRAKHLPSACR